MNKMTGIVLMVFGALVLGVGIVVYATSGKDRVEKEATNSVVEANVGLESNDAKDDADLNYKNGYEFEKFVVKKFNPKHFKVKEWAGDKYVEGVYAETNQNPDLLMEFLEYNQNNKEFAVECKWRQKLYKNGLEFSTPNQLNRYRDYSKKMNVPVFMVLGLGGKGASPEELYVVPLKDITKPFMHVSELEKYKKDMKTNFFYDLKKGELR